MKIVELGWCIEKKKDREKYEEKYNQLRTRFEHLKDHKCCQSSARKNLVVSGLLSMDTRIGFQRLRGGKLLLLFGRYILSQQSNAQNFSKAVFERLDLKERIFLRQFYELPCKVSYIISGTDYYQWSDNTKIFHS